MKQTKFWLKLVGVAFLLHLSLIMISIIEVFIYSYFFSPGKSEEFYSNHATISAPWISRIFGSLFFFLLIRWYARRYPFQLLKFTIALPLVYTIIDFAIVLLAGYNINEVAIPLLTSNAIKMAAALISYFIYKPGINDKRAYSL